MISHNDFKYYKKGQIVPRSICEAKSKVRRHVRFAMDVCVVGNKNIIAVKDSGERQNAIMNIMAYGNPDIAFRNLFIEGNGFIPVIIRLFVMGKKEPVIKIISDELNGV
jgi:hypothetical protein